MQSLKHLYLWLALIVFLLLCYVLLPVLTPFLVSALIAYASNPLVVWLQRWLSRTWAVVVVFMFTLSLLLAFMLILIPVAGQQMLYLYELMPQFISWLQTNVLPWLQQTFNLDEDVWHADKLKSMLLVHIDKAPDLANVLMAKLSSSSAVFFSWLANLLLIPVVTFYLLIDWPAIIKRLRQLVPRRFEAISNKLAGECHEVLGAFIHGQLLVMLSLGVIYTVGLTVVGLELALIVGVIAAFASLVPNLGFIIGLVLALLAGLFQFGLNYYALAGIAFVFIAGRLLESMFLTQALVGDRLGLHPVTVMFALLVGSQLLGFTGVLLALPVAAMLMVLLGYLHSNYIKSRFYKRGEPEVTD
ncbi:MAG: AI-2E family transporter [Thiopseudomonas sp.]|nr:AI-2E family transporter [Thiopseudomonas sp.]MCK9464649.1 AI-2E family transporter [Thiopseudomonas sp.]